MVEEKSGGKLTVQIFPNAQMGNERDTAQAVRQGSLEMGAIGVGLMNWVPEMSITDAPFLWKSRAQCWNAINGAFGDDLRKRSLDKGFVLTGWTDLGFRCMTNNKHPINAAKDMQNLKMRVPNSKAYIAMMQATGATTVAVDLSELYLALRQGVADGQDTPPPVVKSNKYYEVQKYISKTEHMLTIAYTVTNPKFYDSLSADEKAAFNAACSDANTFVRNQTIKDEAETYDFLKAQGMQANLTPDVESLPRGLRAGHRQEPRPVRARAREDRACDPGMINGRNAVKDAASSRRSIRGLHMTFAAPAAIEVLSAAGIEFVYLDGEHGCFDWRDIETGCLVAERHGLTTIARIPDTSAGTITRFLDRGIRGIVAPHVESLDDARHVIESTYFAPLGGRSYGAGRPEYGQYTQPRPEYMQACNAATSICMMIETGKGLEIAGELAALPGVDYVSFGMNDLAQSLGYAGNPGHRDVKDAVAAASERIRKAGKPVREDFMNYVWINDVLMAGARQLFGA